MLRLELGKCTFRLGLQFRGTCPGGQELADDLPCLFSLAAVVQRERFPKELILRARPAQRRRFAKTVRRLVIALHVKEAFAVKAPTQRDFGHDRDHYLGAAKRFLIVALAEKLS